MIRRHQTNLARVQAKPLCRAWLMPILVVVLMSGCTTGLGPKAIRSERPDFNRQVVRSGDEQMLLNLVRLRYNDTPLFLELGTVLAQYHYGANLNAGGTVSPDSSSSSINLGGGLAYSESPTITYTPLAGDEYAERMLTPIPLDSLMLFNQTGWSQERLMVIAVQRINNVFNAPSATGPTPEDKPEFEDFHQLSRRLRRLQQAGVVGMNWEMKLDEKDPPGRNPRFWIDQPQDPNSTLADDAREVRRLLELDPNIDDFQLTAFPFDRQPNQIGIRCRSLLGVLYFLATSVEVPAPHREAGLVTVTRDANGGVFNWSDANDHIMTIRSQQERPTNASVAVKHRDYWFYIADNDQMSKSSFSLLNILFSLQSASAKGKSPVLTLPVGR